MLIGRGEQRSLQRDPYRIWLDLILQCVLDGSDCRGLGGSFTCIVVAPKIQRKHKNDIIEFTSRYC